MMYNSSILIIGNEVLVSEGLISLLKNSPYDFKHIIACTYNDIEKNINLYKPNIFIFHLKKGNQDLYDNIVGELVLSGKVIVICHSKSSAVFKQLLKQGTLGLVTIDEGSQPLIDSLKPVSNNEFYMSPKVLEAILLDYIKSEENNEKLIDMPSLTKREKEVLKLLALGNKNIGIAENLCISVHTVDTHRKNIVKKFNVKTSLEMIHKAVNYGII